MMYADEDSQVEFNWPQIGSHPLNEYSNKTFMVVCFTGLFLNGIGDLTTKVRQRAVII